MLKEMIQVGPGMGESDNLGIWTLVLVGVVVLLIAGKLGGIAPITGPTV